MKYYGIDAGATQLRISRVDPEDGRLLGRSHTFAMRDITSNDQLTGRIAPLIESESSVGISAAGHVDEEGLMVRVATNSSISDPIRLGRDLAEQGHRVVLTNDIKAAAQAAARYGQGRGHASVVVATYSSGFNCALVRGGESQTTAEFGHMAYKPQGDLYCSCGAKGHLETYVSGNGAAFMARQYLAITKAREHVILDRSLRDLPDEESVGGLGDDIVRRLARDAVGAKHVYQAFRQDPEGQPQRDIREVQVQAIADSFGKMASVYHPVDILVLMGSQTLDWEILFTPAIARYRRDDGSFQLKGLRQPAIVRNEMEEIGVRGAVAYLISRLDG